MTVTGAVDYVMRIVTTDMHAYDNFLRDKILALGLVSDIQSRIIVNVGKAHDRRAARPDQPVRADAGPLAQHFGRRARKREPRPFRRAAGEDGGKALRVGHRHSRFNAEHEKRGRPAIRVHRICMDDRDARQRRANRFSCPPIQKV